MSLLAAITVALVLLVSRKIGERLYPRSFYLFGRNHRVYSSLQSKRQLWGIAIAVGFLVNVAAGVAVAVMMR
ncbi:MAG: hypothetical protein WB683_08095 [Candidatus Sulfotelmatobacter sp.]